MAPQEDTDLVFARSDFPFTDAGDALAAVTVVTLPDATHGALYFGNPRKAVSAGDRVVAANLDVLVFAPASGYVGSASFRFKVEDSAGAESGANTVFVRVLEGPPAPGRSVLGVSLVSKPGADATYAADDTIRVRATFTGLVNMPSGTHGNAGLKLEFVNGDNRVQKTAAYDSGNGKSSLEFTYEVEAQDAAPDGVGIVANSLAGIQDTSSPLDLAHSALAADTGHKVDGVAPGVMGAPTLVSAPASGDTYGRGEHIEVGLTFSEPVNVNGAPQLDVLVGAETRTATYRSGSGTATLTFRYTVAAADADADGVSIPAGTVALQGGAVTDPPGNAATLAYTALAALAAHKVKANSAPVAHAGSDVTVAAGAIVVLDGRASADADGDTLTYAWEQTSGTSVTLDDKTRVRPAFTAPAASADLEFSLTVSDGVVTSAASTVSVTVDTSVAAPVFAPADGAMVTDAGTDITLTFAEALRQDADGAVLGNADLAAVLTLKRTDENGADIGFSATIDTADTAKTVITVAPEADLSDGAVYVAISSGYFDARGNQGAAAAATFTVDTIVAGPVFAPADGATVTGAGTDITLTFAEAVWKDAAGAEFGNADLAGILTLKRTDENGADIGFSASIDAAKQVITVDPAANLAEGDVYVAISDGYFDAAGNQGAAAAATFTVDTSVAAPAFRPADGVRVGDAGRNITLTFAEAVSKDAAGAEFGSADLAGILTLKRTDENGADIGFSASIDAAKQVITIDPTADLADGAVYVAISDGYFDAAGNQGAAAAATFTMVTSAAAPVFSPAAGATVTDAGTDITLTFAEALRKDADGAELADADLGGILTLKRTDENGADIGFSASIDEDKQVITIDPTADLADGAVYVAISDGYFDAEGNQRVAAAATFTVDTSVAAPVFVPAAGATVSDAGMNITLTFAEAVRKDAAGGEFGNADLAGILTLKRTDENGADIGFSASIDAAKQVITIDPTADLADGAVYVAISDGYFDAAGNQGAAADATFTVDTSVAAPAFRPADGVRVTDAGRNITLTFAEAVRKDAAGGEFGNADLAGILTLKRTDENGADIGFSASIDAAKQVITIDPTADLADGAVYVAISDGYFDAAGNQGAAADATFTMDTSVAAPVFAPAAGATVTDAGTNITLTFAEAVRKDAVGGEFGNADLAGILTLKRTDENGADIGFSASIDTAKQVITIDPTADLADGAVYVAISDGYFDAAGNPGAAADATFTVDTTAPTFSSAVVAGTVLTVTFDEPLGAAARLANTAFTVKKTPSGGMETNVSLSTTAPSISGSTVVLTLASAVVATDGSVKVSYAKPATGTDNKIKDAAGNETASFSDQTAANDTDPAITIVAGTSPVTEGTAAEFTVTADVAPSAALTVNLTVADASGSDFVAAGDEGSKTVAIAVNTTSATYSVDTVGDTTDEPDGDVTVTVASGTGYTVGSTGSASVTVNDDDGPPDTTAPDFGTATVANQNYALNVAITNLVLPEATGGDGVLAYALTPALPAGLSFDAATRTLSGTPTAGHAVATYTYKVTDEDANTEDSDADTLTFTIAVPFGCAGSTAVGGSTVTSGGLVNDCEALLASEATLVGTGTALNWDTGTAMASWAGVTLLRVRVTNLELFGRSLSGSIPKELGNLSALTVLRLNSNSLSGSIPKELGNLSALLRLELRSNSLSGSIPKELGDLSALTVLSLYSNSLSGSIPKELGNLSVLVSLLLQHNSLSESIPKELGNLSSLRTLFLNNNSLSGSIPKELGNLSAVSSLFLSGNSLSGCIPSALLALRVGATTITINPQRNNVHLPVCPGVPVLTLKPGDARIAASWTAPAGGTPTDYDLNYKLSSASDWTDASHTGTGTTATIDSLTNGSEYDVRVRANTATDTGDWSETKSATPIDASVAAPVFAPAAGATVTDAGTNITLTFAEAVRKDAAGGEFGNADLAGILTLKRTDENGADIGFSATIDAAKQVITVDPTADLADGAVYVAISDGYFDAAGNQGAAADATFTVDTTGPAFSSASVAGTVLTITFNEALDTSGDAPVASAFSLAGADNNASVTAAAFKTGEATKVELTLSPAVAHGDSGITVDYTKPAANPLQDDAGNEVKSFSGQEVSNDTPVTVSAEAGSATEGSAVTFKAKLSGAVGSDVVLGWTTGNDDTTGARQATSGTDYTAVTNGSVTITAGQTEASFSVSTISDTATEGDETFKVTITGTTLPAGVTIVTASAIGTIEDDDGVTVSVEAGSATEGSAVTFKAKLSAAVASNVVLGWTTGDDDTTGARQATAGTDYTAVTNGSVTITAGQTEASFSVSTTADTDTEGDETFKVTITGTTLPDEVTIVTASAIGTIEDDDGVTVSVEAGSATEGSAVTFKAKLSSVVGSAVVLGWTTGADDTTGARQATAGTDYTAVTNGSVTIAANQTEASFTVSTTADTDTEGDETFKVTITGTTLPAGVTIVTASAIGTIEDDDGETVSVDAGSATEGSAVTFKAKLSSAVGSNVVLGWTTGNDDTTGARQATAGTDYTAVTNGSVTIAASQTEATFTVSTTADTDTEGDETFKVTITGTTLPAGVTIVTASAIGTIEDDDGVTVSVEAGSATEGSAVTFKAKLSGAVGSAVVLGWTTGADDTTGARQATAGTDYTAVTNGSVTIAANQTEASFTVSTTADTTTEGDETFKVTITGTTLPAGVTIGTASAIGTIEDDDGVTVSVEAGSATEGSAVTFKAKLSAAVGSAVVLGWTTGADDTTGARQATAGTDYTAVTNGSVTIAANQTEASFTVSTTADTTTEGDETFKVTITGTTLPAGVTIGTASAIGTIKDDDGVAVSVEAGSATEGSAVTFKAKLSAAVGSAVVLGWTTGDDDTTGARQATAGTDYTAVTNGSVTIAANQTEASFTVSTTADTDTEGDETFKVTITGTTLPAGVTIVTASAIGTIEEGDAPTASNFSKTVNEDTTLTFAANDFTGAFSDPDGHTLKSVKIVTLPTGTHGTLKSGNPLTAVDAGDSITAADLGTLTFEPVANWNGTASFTYKVTDSDDEESAAAATVTITVSAVDDAPTASNFSKTVNEDTTLTFAAADFTGAFSDPDGHTLKSVKIVTLPTGTHGTLKSGNPLTAVSAGDSIAAADLGTIRFEPVANWNGSASFTYKVTDSSDAESAAAATASITVSAVDDRPTASDFSKTVNEDTTLTFAAGDFTGAFSDPDGHTLKSVKIVTLPTGTHGTLKSGNPLTAVDAGDSIAAADLGTLRFEPVANWNGSASFTYKVTDSSDAESAAAATASITVSAVDDRPTASDFSKTVNEGTTLSFAASDFTGSFSDPDGHTLKSVKIVTLPTGTHGTLKSGNPLAAVDAGDSIAAAALGTLRFEPATNWNGPTSFTYKVTDSSGAESAAAATVSIRVTDDSPSASDISKTVNEDTTLSFAAADFTGAFSDPDGDTLKSVKIVTLPTGTHGTLKSGNPLAAVDAGDSIGAADLGTLRFEPVANWNGTASFTYKVTDSDDEESAAAATVTITVSAVDDAPTASNFSKTVNEDTTLSFAAADFTAAFRDVDGHTLKSVKIVTLPTGTHGTLKSGNPLTTVSAGDSIAAAALSTLRFEPVANWNGTASFTYKVTDSSDAESAAAATVSIRVTDDAPSASDITKTVNEDTTLSFTAADFTGAFSDPDGDTLKSVKIVTLPTGTHGKLKVGTTDATTSQVVLAANLGTISFEPVANWNGAASFTYKVTDSDDEESAAAATVTITVSAVDDAPTASNFSKTVNEDTTLSFTAADFTGAFSDPDGHTLKSVKIITLPTGTHGKLKVGTADATANQVVLAASLGTISFEPVANWNGTASFTYKVTDSDDEESAAAATVSITVSAVGDAPTASDFSKSVNEDTTLSFAASDFTGAFSDPDGHTLKSVKIVTLPTGTHGKLKVGTADATANQVVLAASLGTISFEPVANWNGTASFTYKVTDSDDEESAAAATVSITVSAVDDAPTASDFSKSVNEDTTLTFAANDFTGAFSDPDGHTLKSVKIVTLPNAEHGKLKVGTADATANQVVLAASLGTISFEPAAN